MYAMSRIRLIHSNNFDKTNADKVATTKKN